MAVCPNNSTESRPCSPPRRHASSLPPRPAGPNDPLGATVRTRSPPSCRHSTFSRHSTERGLALALGTRGNSRGSEWGLGPLRIGSTTAEVSAIHWFAASRLRRRRQVRYRRSARAASGDPRRHRPMIPFASRMSEQTAPNPGTSCGGALGEDGRPGEGSDGKPSGPEHQARRGDHEVMPAPDAKDELGRRLRPRARRR